MGQYKIYYTTTTNTSTSPFFWNYPYSVHYVPYFSNNSSANLYNMVKELFSEYKMKLVPDKATKIIDVE